MQSAQTTITSTQAVLLRDLVEEFTTESAALGNGRESVRQDHWPLIPAERAA